MEIKTDGRFIDAIVTGFWSHHVTLHDGTLLELGIVEGEQGFAWSVSGDTERSVPASDGTVHESYENALDAAISYLRGLD